MTIDFEAAVEEYLLSLEGAPTEADESELAQVNAKLFAGKENLVEELFLIQRRLELTGQAPPVIAGRIHEQFVAALVPYSRTYGISWAAWRDYGVPSAVLAEAGITSDAPIQQAPEQEGRTRAPKSLMKSPETKAKVAQLFVDGVSAREVAAQFGFAEASAHRFRHRLVDEGILTIVTPGGPGRGPVVAYAPGHKPTAKKSNRRS